MSIVISDVEAGLYREFLMNKRTKMESELAALDGVLAKINTIENGQALVVLPVEQVVTEIKPKVDKKVDEAPAVVKSTISSSVDKIGKHIAHFMKEFRGPFLVSDIVKELNKTLLYTGQDFEDFTKFTSNKLRQDALSMNPIYGRNHIGTTKFAYFLIDSSLAQYASCVEIKYNHEWTRKFNGIKDSVTKIMKSTKSPLSVNMLHEIIMHNMRYVHFEDVKILKGSINSFMHSGTKGLKMGVIFECIVEDGIKYYTLK